MLLRFGQWVIRLERAALSITEPIEERAGVKLVWAVIGSIFGAVVFGVAVLIWIRAGTAWLVAVMVLSVLLYLMAEYARYKALRGNPDPPSSPKLTVA